MTTMWHLPPAPAGLEYPQRTFREKRVTVNEDGTYSEALISGSNGVYCTTGLFPVGAPNAKVAHLQQIPVLFLDCDLCDYMLQRYPADQRNAWDKATAKQAKLATKYALQQMTQAELKPLVQELATYANQWLKHVTGQKATYTISSGYGVHLYLWLQAGQGLDLDACRQSQLGLVQAINNGAGFELADKGVKDAGTRVLRVPGTNNGKGNTPRPVEALDYALTTFDRQALPNPPAIVHTPPQTPPPSATGPAPTPQGSAGEATGLDALWEQAQQRRDAALRALFTECPFFLWALENPGALGLRTWYGAATNIAAIADEAGREEFHAFSRRDEARYNPDDCNHHYTAALQHIQGGGGPWTYGAFSKEGDWPGTAPKGCKAPAVLAAQSARRPDTSDLEEPLILDAKGFPVKAYTNCRRVMRGCELYGKRLRWNEMHGATEYDGQPIVDAFYGDVQEAIQDRYGIGFALASVQQAVYEVAYANKYHPVQDYLQGLTWDGLDRLPQLLRAMQVEDNPLHRQYLQCFLISAVRRGLCEDHTGTTQPAEGVKVDTTLILSGEQGYFKSTFFNALAGTWFSDTPMQPGNKDSYLSVTRHWIIEWAEFERSYGKDVTITKAFLAAKRDSFRRPYARMEETQARRCVIVGTTNEDHFLHDATGSRRFWVLPIQARIDIATVRSLREQVWAQAVAQHRQGVPHWLTTAADAQRAEANAEYQQEEPWEALIVRWLYSTGTIRPLVTLEQVMQEAVQKPAEQWKPADGHLVGRVLKKMRYTRRRVQLDGKRGYVYHQPGVNAAEAVKAEYARTNVVPFRAPPPQQVDNAKG